MSEPIARLRAIFHGEVQGVGFRFTARSAASAHPELTGMVRNLSDGTVELIVEGDKESIGSLLFDIQKLMSSYISNIDIHWSRRSREYTGFLIGF